MPESDQPATVRTLDEWGWSPLQREAALEGLRTSRNLAAACARAGISIRMLRERQRGDADFAAESAAARDEWVAQLAHATVADALHGFRLTRTTRRRIEGADGLEVVEEVEQEHLDNTLRIAVLARLDPATWARKDGAVDITTGGKPLRRLIVEVDDDDDPEPEPAT